MQTVLLKAFERILQHKYRTDQIEYDVLMDRAERLKEKLGLQYAVYSMHKDPSDIICIGRCVFYDDGRWHNSGVFQTQEYVDPTFEQAFVEFEKYIHHSGDRHHIFLEDVRVESVDGQDIRRIHFETGS